MLLLRERVARLEKRLVDVDSKLGLLLARGSSEPARPALRFDRPREQRPVDLDTIPTDGLASIDIERGRGAAAREEPVNDPPIIDNADSDDDGGTVTIRMNGDERPSVERALEHSGLRGQGGQGGSEDEDPLAAMTSAADLYAWGQARFKEGRTTEAVAAFEDVSTRFPGHDLADNALYWIGRCHQQKGDHRLAIDAWQKLPARFPRSPKVPDGLFGMAQSHEALGEPAVAEALYDEVVSSYPKAEKLKDARKALSRLRPR